MNQDAGRRRDELDLLGRLPADLDEGRAVACADLLRLRQIVEEYESETDGEAMTVFIAAYPDG